MIARAFRSLHFLSPFETLTALLLLALPALGQTEVNLQTQGRNPDFSTMPFTRPMTVGSAVPATCQLGQLFFNSSAAPGSNIYACTATNNWTAIGNNLGLPLSIANGGTGTARPSLVAGSNIAITGTWPNQTISATGSGGGITQLTGDANAGPGMGSQAITLATVNSNVGTYGGATAVPVITVNAKGLITAVTTAPISGGSGNGATVAVASQLQDFTPTISGSSATFGSSCSNSTPCLIYLNGTRYVFSNASSLSISGSASDTIYFYVDTTGAPTLGYNSANTYTGTNLTTVSNISAFPQGSYPVYQCTVSSGSITGCADYRPILSQTSFSNGQGTTISQNSGLMAINVSEIVDTISSASYTVPNTACGHLEISTSSSSATWNLQQPGMGGVMPNGCVVAIKAAGSGSITVQPSNATINGASTYVVASGHTCRVVSDGANYQTEVCP